MLPIPGALNTLNVDTFGSSYDTVLYVRQGACDALDLACRDDDPGSVQSSLSLTNLPAGPLYIFVDGWSLSQGFYTLHVSGQVALGQRCDPTLAANGVCKRDRLPLLGQEAGGVPSIEQIMNRVMKS